MRLRSPALVVVLTCGLSSLVAHADTPRAGDAAAAEALFAEGKRLMTAGRYAEACPKFAESERLDPGIGTMLWLGECHAKNGQLASSWAMFKEAEALAVKSSDKRAAIAREEAAKLEPKLSKLTIEVPRETEVDGLVVKRDGVAVGKALWGTAVPTDGGTHEISAAAPGRKPWKGTVTLSRENGSASIRVPALLAAPAPPPPSVTAPPPAEPTSNGKTQRILGLGVAGLGVVGVVVGSIVGLHAGSLRDQSRDHCYGNACDSVGFAARKDALSAATTSTVLFVVGGVAIAGGAALYLTAPSGASVGVGPAGVAGQF